MKHAFITLLAACAGAALAQPEVSVVLRSFRTELKTHGSSTKPALVLHLEFTPAPGFSLCPAVQIPGSLEVTDASGKSYPCAPAALQLEDESGQSAHAIYSLSSRPKGSVIQVTGELQVTLVSARDTLPRQEVHLLQDSSFHLGGTTYRVVPAAGNADQKNREGEMLRRAEIAIYYPIDTTIMQISRVWHSNTPEADSEASGYSQELAFASAVTADGSENCTRLELWDASPTETLEITTCKNPHRVKTPVHFSLSLGEVTEEEPGKPAQP